MTDREPSPALPGDPPSPAAIGMLCPHTQEPLELRSSATSGRGRACSDGWCWRCSMRERTCSRRRVRWSACVVTCRPRAPGGSPRCAWRASCASWQRPCRRASVASSASERTSRTRPDLRRHPLATITMRWSLLNATASPDRSTRGDARRAPVLRRGIQGNAPDLVTLPAWRLSSPCEPSRRRASWRRAWGAGDRSATEHRSRHPFWQRGTW